MRIWIAMLTASAYNDKKLGNLSKNCDLSFILAFLHYNFIQKVYYQNRKFAYETRL